MFGQDQRVDFLYEREAPHPWPSQPVNGPEPRARKVENHGPSLTSTQPDHQFLLGMHSSDVLQTCIGSTSELTSPRFRRPRKRRRSLLLPALSSLILRRLRPRPTRRASTATDHRHVPKVPWKCNSPVQFRPCLLPRCRRRPPCLLVARHQNSSHAEGSIQALTRYLSQNITDRV